ncbi:MAG: sugar phosphate isomerase/epimerase [Acidobacteriota bacterium]|nr:sugar phosphate isomerase/epimerase [Acidobacteriota bacterium]
MSSAAPFNRAATRRNFLRLTAMAAAAGCILRLPGSALAEAPHLRYGVQLFMVRAQAPADLAGVLRTIHQIGFTEIELYPIVYNHTAAELRQMVQDSGLRCPAAHFNYDGLESRVDFARQLGVKFMVCPMVPFSQWNSLDGFREAAKLFNRVGAQCRDAGMELCFHNHCYEFKPMEGSTGFATLMRETDPALLKLELDIYWLVQGGQDPAAMMRAHAQRVRLLHLKDRTPGAPTGYAVDSSAIHITEMGKGSIAWPQLFAQAKALGVRYAFLDEDVTPGPVFDSMRQSFAYLQSLHA